MEPNLATDSEHLAVLDELMQREPIFHRPELGTTRRDFERMTDPAFWEVGASGRRYSRAYVLDELEKRYANPAEDRWETKDFHCQQIARDNYLLTYTLLQGERVTRRSTIWRRTEEGWKIVYHQGTIVEEPVEEKAELSAEEQAVLWQEWVESGPQGPISDEETS